MKEKLTDEENQRNIIYNGLTDLFDGVKINVVIEGLSLFLADTFYQVREMVGDYEDPIQAQIDALNLRIKHYIETMNEVQKQLKEQS